MLASLHAPLHAQEAGIPRFEAGLVASFGYGVQTGRFPLQAGLPNCGEFSEGRIVLPWLGGAAQWQQLFGEHLGLQLRLGWSPAQSRYTADPVDTQKVVDLTTHTLVTINREFRLDAAFQTISLDMLLRWRPAGRLAVALGPSVGYRFASSFTQSDNVLDEGRTFSNNSNRKEARVDSVFTVRRLAFGGAITAAYPLQLWPRATLVPELTLRADFTSAVAQLPWRSASGSIGAMLMFDLSRPADTAAPPPPPDTPRIADTPAAPRLNVALAMHGVDEAGKPSSEAVVSVREVIFRKHTPLLPAIYFDPGSDSIPSRYTRLDQHEARRFSYSSLAELGPLELSHAILSLVGYRMRDDRSARLILYGLSAGDEPKELAADRAAAIRNYLTEAWGISRSRIELRTGAGPMAASDDGTPDGRSENRRVLFSSNSADLLGPVATERVVRDFNPPVVKLDPVIDAEAGVRSWRITVRQGNDTMATFTDDDNSTLRSDLSWRLADDRIDRTLGELEGELMVTDSTGQTKSARAAIGMRLRRDSTVINNGEVRSGETERISFALVAFGYRSTTGEKSHEPWLEDLADQLRAHARVEITGYADRIGNDAFNLELSRGRAQYVATRLQALAAARGVKDLDMIARGGGVDLNRFPNNLPEGRVLSRGATVVAEQPAAKRREP